MFDWLSKYPTTAIALFLNVLLILSGLLYSGWWGPVATGVILGISSYIILVVVCTFLLTKLFSNEVQGKIFPWIAFAGTVVIALTARQLSRSNLAWPIQLQPPDFLHPQSFFLILIAFFLVVLLMAFARSLSRGEGVAIENHWGGLGGGISGFRVSTPMIYLLGIVLLLVVMAAMAWRIYTPDPSAAAGASPTPTPSGRSSPSPSPSPSPPVSPSPQASPTPVPPTATAPGSNRSPSPSNP